MKKHTIKYTKANEQLSPPLLRKKVRKRQKQEEDIKVWNMRINFQHKTRDQLS